MEERTPEELEWYMERFAVLIQICLDENQKTLKHPYDTEVVVTLQLRKSCLQQAHDLIVKL